MNTPNPGPPDSPVDRAVDTVCGPRYGYTSDTLTDLAAASWRITGSTPAWPYLDGPQRQHQISIAAHRLLAAAAAPPPPDPRPVDHTHPGAPPWPDGHDEHHFWAGRVAAHRAGRRGRAGELDWLDGQLAAGAADAVDGVDVCAWLITTLAGRADQLCSAGGDRHRQDHADWWLRAARVRQQARCDTRRWPRGRRRLALLLRHHGRFGLPAHPGRPGADVPVTSLSPDLVVIAVHDAAPWEDPHRLLADWTGDHPDIVELAVDVTRNERLVRDRPGGTLGLTRTGERCYQRLLAACGATTTSGRLVSA
jgi:hypothetical protein